EFDKIRAGQIEANAIDGMTVTGTTLQSRDGNFRAGDDGVYIAQPDGTSLVRFPTDGSPLSMTAADVEIERANVDDLELLNGSVRSGGRFTLESGVVARCLLRWGLRGGKGSRTSRTSTPKSKRTSREPVSRNGAINGSGRSISTGTPPTTVSRSSTRTG